MSKPLLLIFLFLCNALLSQTNIEKQIKNYKELGIPYMQHYEPKEYNGRPDNQAILQGDNGLMYIGNSRGVLEFDGISWRLIQLPNSSLIRTLAKNEEGKLFVGGFNELGYLEPDSLGFTTFHSIKSYLNPKYQNFNYLHNSFIIGKQVYFQSKNYLFRWADNAFKVWSSNTEILYAAEINGTVYLQEKGNGLSRLEDDQIQLITSFNKGIVSLLPFGDNRMLVATRQDGLFILQGANIFSFPISIDPYIKENGIVQVKKMPNGWITIGTGHGGLVVLDEKLSLINIFDKNDGLLNNSILAQELDNQGGLWLGLDYGIARIELLSPYTIYDERMGVTGFINSITRYKGDLFAASIEGLLRFDGSSPPNKKFQKVPLVGPSFYLSEIDDELYIASKSGTFNYKEKKAKPINQRRSGALLNSKKDSSILYLGLFDGLAVLKKENGVWKDFGKIEGIKDDIRELVELEDGKLWMESQIDGVWLVDFYHNDTLDIKNPEIKQFLANKELPPGWLFLHSIQGKAVFEISGIIYRYNQELDSIMPDNSFGEPFGFKGEIVPKLEDEQGNLWISGQFSKEDEEKQRTVSVLEKDGGYVVMPINDKRIVHGVKKALFPEGLDILWYGGPDGIVRQDLRVAAPNIANFKALIRKIFINSDSIVFGGTQASQKPREWEFGKNTLRFEYASPSYSEITENEYRYYLEGFDKEWSDWTNETKKDYTQIPEGDYAFRVKTKNVYHQLSKEDNFAFSILPPWYRTWWSYGTYFILFIGSLLLMFQWRSRRLKAHNEALEKLVEVRTSEVSHQASQLKVQAEKLKELDKAKSRFFANISHEFRTPLTLIKGPIEQLEQNFDEKMSMETVKMIRRNANRVLNMVNQLLDLSKFDEGSLKLTPTEGDVFKCIRAATSSFNSHAAQRDIDYKVQIPQEVLWASFDRGKLENIIYNLLGNAFKFSEDGSEISFIASFETHGLQILVSDTGRGIPEEKLLYIFDRFYQVDDSNTREKSGSGIGLSLSKDLVELMDGTITVTSEVNKGTFFTVQLPIQKIMMGYKEAIEDTSESKVHTPKKTFVLSKTDDRNLPTLLLVEDNTDMRHFIKEQLIKYYRVNEATNGAEGLKMARANPSDLIITDLMMPKMDGIELCKKLKTDVHTSHIPVIMLTAKAGLDNKLEGLETGADDYLTKPFDAKELLIRANNLISQRQRLRELYSDKEVRVDPKTITVTSIDQKFLEELLSLLEEHHSNADFGVPQMQDALAMSKTQLHRKLKALTNEAPGELLRNFRLKRAAQLLSQKADSVTQIAYQVGFNNLSYFAKCFKELYGVAPSSY